MFVKVMRADSIFLQTCRIANRCWIRQRWKGRDWNQIRFVTIIDNPNQLWQIGPIELRRLVGDDQKATLKQGQHCMRESGEWRRVIPSRHHRSEEHTSEL